MKKYLMLLVFGSLYASSGFADVRCGDYTLTASNDGFMHINGVRPETQKFTFLGQKKTMTTSSTNGALQPTSRENG